MFKKLKEKWGVSWLNFILIFCTFAIGGSSCGYLGKKLLSLVFIDKSAFYYVVYFATITLLWPLCVIVISIPFGQFLFFKNYLLKMKKRMFN